jgi:hypothetical protein
MVRVMCLEATWATMARCAHGDGCAELSKYDGTGGNPVYVGAKGKVFDVGCLERGWRSYGPEGGYRVFSARDASWALATFSLSDPSSWPGDATWESLEDSEKRCLDDWVDKFENGYRYPIVGWIEDGFYPSTADSIRPISKD